ncbi:MAG: NAD(P)/FAD-dependent oxidoreductase [Balneolaceae bacterium]|nr:NAD(P)/FAD-dependent oxidoreductase [Balneolaceae bacterium]
MSDQTDTYQVIIVGGGPVGLFLGYCLEHLGISCIILEKRTETITHSRSLGIHPVSLELFQKLGLAAPFVENGIKIFRGIACNENGRLGSISFKDEPLPFNFILSIPQFRTEELLEQKLNERNSNILHRGATLIDIEQQSDGVFATYKKNGKKYQLNGKFIVGCDGKNSKVRQLAEIDFEGSMYPDTYMMGDFTDNTDFGNDAVVYLHKKGLIESFPLPGKMRRWVVKTDTYISDPTKQSIVKLVAERTNHDLREQKNVMISTFGVQKLMADPLFKNRVILAGDAAHIVSPIGGQGMNLGWVNSWFLAKKFKQLFDGKVDRKTMLRNYASEAKKNTRKVVYRSEINMKLGRKKQLPVLRNALAWFMLNTPLRKVMAKLFTMRKLDKWPI